MCSSSVVGICGASSFAEVPGATVFAGASPAAVCCTFLAPPRFVYSSSAVGIRGGPAAREVRFHGAAAGVRVSVAVPTPLGAAWFSTLRLAWHCPRCLCRLAESALAAGLTLRGSVLRQLDAEKCYFSSRLRHDSPGDFAVQCDVQTCDPVGAFARDGFLSSLQASRLPTHNKTPLSYTIQAVRFSE